MKALLRLLVLFVGICSTANVSADSGPYYFTLRSGNACQKLKLYLGANGVSVYGGNVGCDGSRSTLYISNASGFYDWTTGRVIVSHYFDTARIGTLRLGMVELFQIDLATDKATKFAALDMGDTAASGSNQGNATEHLPVSTWTWVMETN